MAIQQDILDVLLKKEKMTGEAPEERSDKKKPVEPNLSISIYQYQSALIRINQHQSESISIDQHQSRSISNNQHANQHQLTSVIDLETIYTCNIKA